MAGSNTCHKFYTFSSAFIEVIRDIKAGRQVWCYTISETKVVCSNSSSVEWEFEIKTLKCHVTLSSQSVSGLCLLKTNLPPQVVDKTSFQDKKPPWGESDYSEHERRGKNGAELVGISCYLLYYLLLWVLLITLITVMFLIVSPMPVPGVPGTMTVFYQTLHVISGTWVSYHGDDRDQLTPRTHTDHYHDHCNTPTSRVSQAAEIYRERKSRRIDKVWTVTSVT